MIVVDQVHKRFGNLHAVQGVSFALRPGQIAGLLGHNGAGKTTTIRMITSCIMPDAGCVRVGEHDTRDARHQAMRLLGYLPEATPLYHEMPVEDYLHYRGRLWSMPRKDRTRAIARVLERCWLRDVSLRRIGTLSKGYKQRVGLASALLHDPPALVLDEPTNGLDPTQVHETRSLVRELAADRTVLLSSHILTEVEKLCDRVVIIAGGVVKADGSPSELAAATGLGGVQLAAFAPEEDKSSAHALAAAIAAMEGVTRVSQQWAQTPGGPLRAEQVRAEQVRAEHVRAGQFQPGQAQARSVWSCFVQSAGADTQALREQIALAALAHRVPLHLVREQRATLEQVFAHATDSAGASAASAAANSETAGPVLAPPASIPHAASWDAARREVAPSEQQLRLRARLDAAASAEQSQPPATLDGPRAGGTP